MKATLFSIVLISVGILMGCGSDEIINPDKQLNIDIAAIDQYLEDNNITDAIAHSSGLRYRFVEAGTGTKPQIYHYIRVKYQGSLMSDGTVFDESAEGKYATFAVSGVIEGWQIGLRLMPEGTKAILYIPSSLAYGKIARTEIPANSNLIFEVELIDVIE